MPPPTIATDLLFAAGAIAKTEIEDVENVENKKKLRIDTSTANVVVAFANRGEPPRKKRGWKLMSKLRQSDVR